MLKVPLLNTITLTRTEVIGKIKSRQSSKEKKSAPNKRTPKCSPLEKSNAKSDPNTLSTELISDLKLIFSEELLKEKEFKDYISTLDRYNRVRSWESCYVFFHENKGKLLATANTVHDKAASDLWKTAGLQLGFYLASYGMFRGSTKQLGINNFGYERLLKNIASDLVAKKKNFDCSLSDLRLSVEKALTNPPFSHENPSPILITKILMGISGRSPAFDTQFGQGLSAFKKENTKYPSLKKMHATLTSLEDWEKIAAIPEVQKKFESLSPVFLDSNKPYPTIKVLDLYFWKLGKKSNK